MEKRREDVAVIARRCGARVGVFEGRRGATEVIVLTRTLVPERLAASGAALCNCDDSSL